MSIILFGKGPSVLKCSREIVEKHKEIGICNYPVLNDFFMNLIKNRTILYHFANCGGFDKRYTNDINKKIGIQKIFNTNIMPPNKLHRYKIFLKNDSIFSDENIYENYYNSIKNKHNFLPSTGIIMLKYIIDKNIYNTITLVGYDNFQKGSDTYYYSIKNYNEDLKYLINKSYDSEGKFIINSGHDVDKTKKYMEYLISTNTHIQFNMITNMKFENKYENLNIL